MTVEEFLKNGGKITVGEYRGPRSGEKTFGAGRGSVFTMGAKAQTLQKQGLNKRKHG